jgi:hypothetical protein
MMSANSNVRRRGCATVQGTKTGALRSTCKGAGWTPPFIPNIASPTFDIHMLPLTASRSASVRTAPFANRSASPAPAAALLPLRPDSSPAVEVMRKPGGIFMADEVQPGFGRLGTHVWGFARHRLFARHRHGRQAHGQRPSGLARRLLRPEVIESLGKRIRYFNTFGGNPVSCARVHAVLKAIKAGRLLVLISANGT